MKWKNFVINYPLLDENHDIKTLKISFEEQTTDFVVSIILPGISKHVEPYYL